MCGIVGIINYTKDISNQHYIISDMNQSIAKRGPDEQGYFMDKHVNFGHKRLIVIDPEGGKQPMTATVHDNTYTIVYNGQIYNANDLRKELEENGFYFEGHCDTEVLLKAYIYWGHEVVNKLNGIFSFAVWNHNNEELFLARDHFGIKPLYYTITNKNFIFSSEIKAILKHPEVETAIDSQGICELFGLGPAHTPGTCAFKNIFEIKPAHFAVYNRAGLHIERYWKLETKEHNDNFTNTCEKVKFLLDDAIKRQLVSDVPLCLMLSRRIGFEYNYSLC